MAHQDETPGRDWRAVRGLKGSGLADEKTLARLDPHEKAALALLSLRGSVGVTPDDARTWPRLVRRLRRAGLPVREERDQFTGRRRYWIEEPAEW